MSNTHEIGASDFLDLIHGPNAVIYFQVAKNTWKNKPQTFRQAEPALRWRNSDGDGICYIVNSGGTKDAQIVRFNACFLDFDSGRGHDGKYLDEAAVNTAKDCFRRRLDSFPLQPSLLVETRNGFHAYWLLKAEVSASEYRTCQRALAEYLGGDLKCVNPARAMRLPGFNWTKPGYAPFPVRVLYGSDSRYSLQRLRECLPDMPKEEVGAFGHHDKCSGIRTTALIVVSKRQGDKVKLPSMAEAIEYLKQQDLGIYLGVSVSPTGASQTISCPYHTDTKASASIGLDSASRRWLFCCHSSNCGVKGSIIDLEMRRLNTADIATALRTLLERYNIEIETDWKQREAAILDRNLAILGQPEAFCDRYPHLYKWTNRIAQDLSQKLQWAKELLLSEKFQVNGRAVFFLSLREMERRRKEQRELPRHFGRQSQRVDRYCILGLMRKVPDGEIPADLLEEAQSYQTGRRQRVQFFMFPEYTPEVLEVANERACRLIQAGATVRGISRPLISDILGAEIADEAYPQQLAGKDAARVEFAGRVEAVLLEQIKADGYTTSARILDALGGKAESVTHRRIDRVLPGLLLKHGLISVTVNAEMKGRLGVAGSGYPKVILPADAGGRKALNRTHPL